MDQINNKIKSMNLVMEFVNSLEINKLFTIAEVGRSTGLQYASIKRALCGLEELKQVSYIKTNKIYIKNNNNIKSSNNINKNDYVVGAVKND